MNIEKSTLSKPLSLVSFRKLLKIHNKYNDFGNFKIKVLDKALKNIEMSSGLKVAYIKNPESNNKKA